MARYLKNIKTGVVTVVGSDEDQRFRDLIAERDDDKRPVYAQTGEHDPAVTQVHVTGNVPSAPGIEDAPDPTIKEIDDLVQQRFGTDEPAAEKKPTAKS